MAEIAIDLDGIPARYMTLLLIGELVDITTVFGEKLNLNVTDTIILASLAFLSSRRGLLDAVDRGKLTTDSPGIFQIQHHPINAKSIHLKLGMSRETVRRRLVYLERRGLIKKRDDGYFFPVQIGEDDVTRHLREYCVAAAFRLRDKLTPYLASVP
jgi:DNA-binding transcriptional ArsR family regulator